MQTASRLTTSSGMGKKPAPEHAWSICRIRKTQAELLGRVYAPDQEPQFARRSGN
jgi:hypothetical protein